jgi:hypothetical protein
MYIASFVCEAVIILTVESRSDAIHFLDAMVTTQQRIKNVLTITHSKKFLRF